MKKFWLLTAVILTVFIGLTYGRARAEAGILDFFYRFKDVLEARGNKIFFNDKEIFLRGVAVGDPHARQEMYGRTADDYRIIKDEWKANVVRLSVHPGVYRKNEKQVKKILEEEVEAARRSGLLVIIDWHVVGMPNGWFKPWVWEDGYGYSYDSSFNTAREFWHYIASQYSSDQGVIFEIWNEPADDGQEEKWSDFKKYMADLYDAIRGRGAKNLIIAPGAYWSYDLRGVKNDPLKGENIAYAWHVYPGSGRAMKWDAALDGLSESYPIFVSEWGFETGPSANRHHFAYLDAWPKSFTKYILDKNLNFTAWCWHYPWTPRMFEPDWEKLTDFGKFVKEFIWRIDNGSAWRAAGPASEEFSASPLQAKIFDFLKNGADGNTRQLGEGERRAVIYSYERAFGALPRTERDLEDLIKIANGRWPSARNTLAEERARASFRRIYAREARDENRNDVSAIMIMSYGLRQRAENRNLISEKAGIIIFKNIFGHTPSSTEEWNAMQAITYSGAKK